MKIVDIAVKKVYRFNCPNCQRAKRWWTSEERYVNSIVLYVEKSGISPGPT